MYIVVGPCINHNNDQDFNAYDNENGDNSNNGNIDNTNNDRNTVPLMGNNDTIKAATFSLDSNEY